jgi:GT2 family glycosyltransferase
MKIIFCIPGNSFSNRFLKCWTNLTRELHKRGVEYELLSQYIPNVYQVRSLLLGADRKFGQYQEPWQGKKNYDNIMWIDSDQVFEPNDFFKLLEHDKDIVSGLYLKKPQGDTLNDIPIEFACFNEDGERLYTNEVNGELRKVWSNGMGWMLVKKGVFEKIEYPWFGPIITGLGFHGEDVSFQLRAKDVGFDSYVDTSIVVGHEKGVVLK